MRRFTFFGWITLLILILAACAAPTSTPTIAPTLPVQQTVENANTSSAPTGQTLFLIDTEKSQASYTVQEQFFEKALPKLGINPGQKTVVGITKQVEGEIRVNLQDLTRPPTGTVIRVNLTDLKTDQSRRDKWIQENGPTFLQYPIATFEATQIRNAPPAYQFGDEVTFQLEGDLTIRNVTKPAVFDVKAKIENGVLIGSASTQIKMSDFGIEPPNFANTLTVGDDVLIRVDIVARQAP